MISAINPPAKKYTKDVTMYMIPICFASVVRSNRAKADPLVCWRTGHGRVTIGFGATVVTQGLQKQQDRYAMIYGPPRSQDNPSWSRLCPRVPDDSP